MKNVIRILALALLICAIGTAALAAPATTYTDSSAYLVDAVGWYFNNDVMLTLNDDGATYELQFKMDIFGTTDPGNKGNKTVIYFGNYTSAPSADGDPCHLDITLDTVDRIYLEQHGKGFGRQEIVNYPAVLDTANWTADYSETVAMCTAEEFLAEYAPNAQGLTFTVEDIMLDISNIELSNRFVTMPFEMPWSEPGDAPFQLNIAR